MSQKSYLGNKAYQSAIKAGKTKTEAKQASYDAKREVDKQYQTFGKNTTPTKGYNDDSGYNFDSGLNGNGTNWHTADDL